MATVYRIRDWEKHFEVSQSKKVKGNLPWIAVPTKHDGKSYRRLMRMEDGPSLFAAWILIAQVAAKCPTRGVLFDDGAPLTAEDLELKTDCPASVFKKALKVLCEEKIGWLEAVENYCDTTAVDCDSSGLASRSDRPTDTNERTNERTNETNERSPVASGVLSDVTDAILRDPAKLAEWHRKAAKAGAVPPGEDGLLKVAGAAERALERGTRNHVGMFVSIVRDGKWEFITQRQEDRARQKLASLVRAPPGGTAIERLGLPQPKTVSHRKDSP